MDSFVWKRMGAGKRGERTNKTEINSIHVKCANDFIE